MDYSPPGSSIHGISQERMLDWDAISPPEDPPHPGVEPVSLAFMIVNGTADEMGGFFFSAAFISPVLLCKQNGQAADFV